MRKTRKQLSQSRMTSQT